MPKEKTLLRDTPTAKIHSQKIDEVPKNETHLHDTPAHKTYSRKPDEVIEIYTQHDIHYRILYVLLDIRGYIFTKYINIVG